MSSVKWAPGYRVIWHAGQAEDWIPPQVDAYAGVTGRGVGQSLCGKQNLSQYAMWDAPPPGERVCRACMTLGARVKRRSPAQVERQRARDLSGGRYRKFNPCELCGKSVGADYVSASDANQTGRGLVLHEKCAEKWEAGARP